VNIVKASSIPDTLLVVLHPDGPKLRFACGVGTAPFVLDGVEYVQTGKLDSDLFYWLLNPSMAIWGINCGTSGDSRIICGYAKTSNLYYVKETDKGCLIGFGVDPISLFDTEDVGKFPSCLYKSANGQYVVAFSLIWSSIAEVVGIGEDHARLFD
jgi:hypothetical protein